MSVENLPDSAASGEIPPGLGPAGLGPAGRRLWSSLTSRYLLDPDEAALAAEAAAVADEITRLRIRLWQADPVVTGSRGQDRPNPLLGELREHRKLLRYLLAGLRVPAKQQESPSAASDAGRGLVAVRWAGENGA